MSNNKFKSAGDKVSDSFCIMPWVHLHTWPNGKVLPCCVADSKDALGNLEDNTLEEIWNLDPLKKLRVDFLKGDKPETCKRCYMQEEMGSTSFRVSSNNQWQHHIDDAIQKTDEDGTNHNFKLNYWDFRFSNVCNLKCRSCGPELSSSWYDDQIKFYGSSTTPRALIHSDDVSKEKTMIYVDRFINDVEEIYFAGGEPFIMEEHYLILEKLIAAGNTKCRIRYNTNFTSLKFKKWDLIELWKPFVENNIDNVRIFASLDGINEVGEYARKNTKWPNVEDNIRRVHAAGMNLWTSTTVSIFNILHLPKFVERMLSLGVPLDKMQMNNVLTFPDYYCINIMPENLKQMAIERLNNHVLELKNRYHSLPKHLQQNYDFIRENYATIIKYFDLPFERNKEDIIADFKKFTIIKDIGRNESFVDVFPYYKEWFESI